MLIYCDSMEICISDNFSHFIQAMPNPNANVTLASSNVVNNICPFFIQELPLNHLMHVGWIRLGATNGHKAYRFFFLNFIWSP